MIKGGDYICDCKKGWSGYLCQRSPNFCGTSDEGDAKCNFHGKCMNNITQSTCLCDYGWGNPNCSYNRTYAPPGLIERFSDAISAGNIIFIIATVPSQSIFNYARLTTSTLAPERHGDIIVARDLFATVFGLSYMVGRRPGYCFGTANGLFWFFIYHATAITVLLYLFLEALNVYGIRKCWHRNNWAGFESDHSMELNMATHIAAPPLIGVVLSFMVIAHNSDHSKMVSSWSNMGRLEDGHYQSVCLQFSVCVMCRTLKANVPHFEAKMKGWFHYYAPSKHDVYHKVLRAKNPRKLESEINLDFSRKEALRQYERDQSQKKRDQVLKEFPDLPTWLLPHVPEDGPVETLEAPHPFNPADPGYIPEYKRNIIKRNVILRYLDLRVEKKLPRNDAIYKSMASEWKRLYGIPQVDKHGNEFITREQLNYIMAELYNDVFSNDLFYYESEYVPKQYETYIDMLDRLKYIRPKNRRPNIDNIDPLKSVSKLMEWPWRVGKLDSVKLHVIDRSGVEEQLTWRHFYRHPYILMPEDLENRLKDFNDQFSKDLAQWDAVYEDDYFIQNMTESEKEAYAKIYGRPITPAFNKHDNTTPLNPRSIPTEEWSNTFWDYKRPGFIGPKPLDAPPTFSLFDLCHEKAFFKKWDDKGVEHTLRESELHDYLVCTAAGLPPNIPHHPHWDQWPEAPLEKTHKPNT
ncbi:hypothetical protein WR25_12793 [Diploscapter pachys]|uniref:EGF-like domain-containing protein n=1 Tax=Diploscapter pachys TaxID=2018661 RepID=A0A2A2K8G7_9BILA|nr:hypothetical protein WR25_12793 [Diploscapter pachys]